MFSCPGTVFEMEQEGLETVFEMERENPGMKQAIYWDKNG